MPPSLPLPLLPTFDATDEDCTFSWSPDGHYLAAQVGQTYSKKAPRLYLIDVKTRRRTEYSHVQAFCWSPQGNRLYLEGSDLTGRILAAQTGSIHTIPHPIVNASWLDEKRLIGDVYPQPNSPSNRPLPAYQAERDRLRIIDIRGKVLLHLTDISGGTYPGYRNWHSVPGHPDLLIAEDQKHISDGPHYRCFQVNLRTGAIHHVRNGRFFGFSPTGKRFAVADYKWLGPYKHGGQRVGSLEIVTLNGKLVRTLTRRSGIISDVLWP